MIKFGLSLKEKVYYAAGKYLPFLKIPPPTMDRQGAMTLRPAHNTKLKWEKQDSGETIITVPQNDKVNFVVKFMAKWLNAPNERRIELDEVGGFVWEQCTGSNTVDAIVQKTGREFKMNRREAEVSVTMFLQMLHERKFIGFYRKSKSKS